MLQPPLAQGQGLPACAPSRPTCVAKHRPTLQLLGQKAAMACLEAYADPRSRSRQIGFHVASHHVLKYVSQFLDFCLSSSYNLQLSFAVDKTQWWRVGVQVCNGVVAAGTGRQTQWDDIAGQEVSLP